MYFKLFPLQSTLVSFLERLSGWMQDGVQIPIAMSQKIFSLAAKEVTLGGLAVHKMVCSLILCVCVCVVLGAVGERPLCRCYRVGSLTCLATPPTTVVVYSPQAYQPGGCST